MFQWDAARWFARADADVDRPPAARCAASRSERWNLPRPGSVDGGTLARGRWRTIGCGLGAAHLPLRLRGLPWRGRQWYGPGADAEGHRPSVGRLHGHDRPDAA